MKLFFTLFACFSFLTAFAESCYNSVYIDSDLNADQTIIDDFFLQLRKVQRIKQISKPSEHAIHFVHQSNINNSIENLGNQEFYIQADSSKIFIVCSGHPDSFQRATYFLLKQFGYYFLWHSENWTIAPEKLNPYLTKGKIIRPKINSLYYFGTGSAHPYTFQKELIARYQRRNFWNAGDYSPVGHAMSGFYKNNKKQIDDLHQQGYIIYNDIDSKHPKDWNFDEPKTLELILNRYRNEIEKNPDITSIDVSPPDGIGKEETLPETIELINHPGEKHWWWIREVALMIQREYPHVRVNVNAYGDGKYHVQPPSFSLPENIMVSIVPDAFQRAYESRQEMYDAWRAVTDQIYYRGYINITQWSEGGLPQLNLKKDMYRMAREIGEMNLLGISMESTYFIVMAPHLFVLSNLWSGYSDKTIDQLYNEWFTVAFPDSHHHMKNMIFRWHEEDFQGETELPFTLRDLNNAYKAATTEEEKARIREYMIYAHYLVLYYQSKNSDSAEKAKQVEDYAKWMNQTGVLQTRAVYDYDYGNIKPYRGGGWDRYFSKEKKSKWYKGIDNNRSENTIQQRVLREFEQDFENYPVEFQHLGFKADEQRMIPANISARKESHNLYRYTFKFRFTPTQTTDLTVSTTAKNEYTVWKNNKIILQDSLNTTDLRVEKDSVYEFHISTNGIIDIEYSQPLAIRYLSPTSHNGHGFRKNSWYLWVPEDADQIVWKGNTVERQTSKPKREFFEYKAGEEWKRLDFQRKIGFDTFSTPTVTDDYDLRGSVIRVHTWRWNWDILNFERIISKHPFVLEE